MNEAVELGERDVWDAARVGYVSSTMVQLTLPQREPDPGLPAWGRRQEGGRSLVVQPGFYLSQRTDAKGHPVPVSLGYPYGSIPRMLLAWVGREVVRTRSAELRPGKSLSAFMREIGMVVHASGGEAGSIGRVRDQIRRLFSSRIALVDDPECKEDWKFVPFQLADSVQTWWYTDEDRTRPDHQRPSDSRIVLSQAFFDEILRSPVPLDMRALSALKQSPMALDVYCWLTWRYHLMRASRKPVAVSWDLLSRQIGSESDGRRFRQLFRLALQKVHAVYPEARFDADDAKHLMLFTSPTHVPDNRTQSGCGE